MDAIAGVMDEFIAVLVGNRIEWGNHRLATGYYFDLDGVLILFMIGVYFCDYLFVMRSSQCN